MSIRGGAREDTAIAINGCNLSEQEFLAIATRQPGERPTDYALRLARQLRIGIVIQTTSKPRDRPWGT